MSYPITAIRKDNPDLLAQIQGEYLSRLEALFVVFDPLTVRDMELTYDSGTEDQEVRSRSSLEKPGSSS